MVLNILLITILFSTTTVKIDKELYQSDPIIQKETNILQNNNKEIGKIIINKINLTKNLYDINSKENTIDKNVEILKESIFPDEENSIVFLAAHSGNSNISFFNDIIKLNINDKIILKYKNKTYNYMIIDIYEENKNGEISYNKENKNQLILTTCHPYKSDRQLIINSIQKEP